MILVNISAVWTSTTFTWMPVSSSHLGPEKFNGSSACNPASQTIVIVVPLYFCASRTAISAALSAMAVVAHDKASAARTPAQDSFFIRLILTSLCRRPLNRGRHVIRRSPMGLASGIRAFVTPNHDQHISAAAPGSADRRWLPCWPLPSARGRAGYR